ncbi:MAG: nuclear transport factor 2 family protein [Pseudomonadota bacterium]|nr:MAG: hypothetical protein DIU62_01885 [Pseudomonadota bacterium]
MNRALLARTLALMLCTVLAVVQAHAAEEAHALVRDVARLESLRTVKDLQRHYAQYTQAGLWDEAASLFSRDARLVNGSEEIRGRAAIERWLAKRGGGSRGLPRGALHIEFIDEPLVNLSVDGNSARGRWMSLTFAGDGRGNARIDGGIYENEYVLEDGRWKIAVQHYHPHYTGPYETGWTNVDGADLPYVPYHFTIEESGIPVPPPAGPAPVSRATPAEVLARIARLNAEDAVRNLQHAFGYYVDRRMWDDVVDLFTDDALVEIAPTGLVQGSVLPGGSFRGRDGVRRAMERMGPAGLTQGVLNDRILFDTVVTILPGGRAAVARGFELAMVGDAGRGTQYWEISIFLNRFSLEGGTWKMQELHVFPLVRAPYGRGWGDGGLAPPANRALPAFAALNPATGRDVRMRGFEVLGRTALAPGRGARTVAPAAWDAATLAAARRDLARSMAWDGSENISSAYGYYIDDFQWPSLGAVFAEKGNKQSPFAGYYFGRERISQAATSMYGAPRNTPRAGIAFHWRIQPVILVAADGRSANLRTRLFQPRTAKQPGSAQIMSGMYPNDQTVLENGIWRLWTLEIDEPYFTMSSWKEGWNGVQPRPADAPRPPPSPLVQRYPPDILMTELGRRAEGFRGGTGETLEWPDILPMWFNYRNPVSGRVPEYYWPDCVPCELRPEVSMTRHGYLMPPTGPEDTGR